MNGNLKYISIVSLLTEDRNTLKAISPSARVIDMNAALSCGGIPNP
jgi:hypothetical protein